MKYPLAHIPGSNRFSSILHYIDSSFVTEQRDLFASGIVAEIGVNAYAVWSAIKYFADYNTGHAWPGMRKLGEKLGAKGVLKVSVLGGWQSVQKALAQGLRTPDIHAPGTQKVSTVQMGDAVVTALG